MGSEGKGLDVGVVGAGAAGLAAAWRLAVAGARVTLYEMRDAVGGGLRTVELGGVRADAAVQLLGTHYSWTLRLAAEVGAGGLLVPAPGRDAVWRGGRIQDVEYGSAASMLLSGALPAILKVRLAARYTTFLARHGSVLDAVDLVASGGEALDGESIARWGEREFGRGFVELLAYPTLAAYYGSTPEETSAVVFHALARAGLSVGVLAVRGGVARLAESVASAVVDRGGSVETGCAVRTVEPGGADVRVTHGGGSRAHDRVVLAVPAHAVAGLLGSGDEARDWLAGVRHRPTVSLVLLVSRPVPGDFFGLSFPRTEPPGDRVAAVCVQARKGAALDEGGRGAVVVFPAPGQAARLAAAESEAVLDFLLPAVTRALPSISGTVEQARTVRFPDGNAVFYPGYVTHLKRFRWGWWPDSVALAGDYLVAPNVEGAVRSGVRAADRLLGRRAGRP